MINKISLAFALRVIIYTSAAYLFLITTLNLNLDIILLTTIYIFISLFLLEKILSYIYIVQISLIVIILFCFGFFVQLGLIIYDPYIFGFSGFTSLGNFNFEFNQFLEIYLVTVVSTSGILVGIYLATRNNINKLYLARINYKDKQKVKKKYIPIIIIFWFVLIILSNYVIDYLGLGRHGLENKTQYPKFVVGLLLYLKGFFLSGMSYCLYDLLVKNPTKFQNKLYFFSFIFVTIFVAFEYSLSKSNIVYKFFPFLMLLIYYKDGISFKKYVPTLNLKFIIYSVIFLICLILLISYLEQKRAFLYSGTIQEINYLSLLDFFKILAVRIEGARDVFLVTDYQNKGLEAYINVNIGKFSPADELYGFSLEGTKFGLTVGFQGLSYLSGSYFVTFLHSLIFILFLCKIEIFFKLRGFFVFSLFITITLVLLAWMNIDLYTIFRYLFITFLISLSCSILKKLFWINSSRKS